MTDLAIYLNLQRRFARLARTSSIRAGNITNVLGREFWRRMARKSASRADTARIFLEFELFGQEVKR